MNNTLELANEFAKELLGELPAYEAKVKDLSNKNAEWVEVTISHEHYPEVVVIFVDGELHSISTSFGLVRANILKVVCRYV